MPSTPTYAIPYPSDTDPADVPADMQEMADRLEVVLGQVAALGVPVGSPIAWLVSGIPAGYREFDGSAIVQATHPQLFAIFGSTIPDLRGRVMLGQGGAPGAAVGATGGAHQITLDPTHMPVHAHTVGSHRHIVDSHGHGGGYHSHGGAVGGRRQGHTHNIGANVLSRGAYPAGSGNNYLTGLVASGNGTQPNVPTSGDQQDHDHAINPETVIANEAPGTSYEAPGTTAAGGSGGVTQPHSILPPYKAVRWITRAA